MRPRCAVACRCAAAAAHPPGQPAPGTPSSGRSKRAPPPPSASPRRRWRPRSSSRCACSGERSAAAPPSARCCETRCGRRASTRSSRPRARSTTSPASPSAIPSASPSGRTGCWPRSPTASTSCARCASPATETTTTRRWSPANTTSPWPRCAGEITSSLFGAVSAAGEDDQLALDLADIFMWDVDFNTELQKGDSVPRGRREDVPGREAEPLWTHPLRRARAGPARDPGGALRGQERAGLLHAGRPPHAQGLPPLAPALHAHQLRVHARTSPSHPQEDAPAPRRRLRRSHRHARARVRGRRRHRGGAGPRLRQGRADAASQRLPDALRAPLAHQRARRPAAPPGHGARRRRVHRPRHRSPSRLPDDQERSVREPAQGAVPAGGADLRGRGDGLPGRAREPARDARTLLPPLPPPTRARRRNRAAHPPSPALPPRGPARARSRARTSSAPFSSSWTARPTGSRGYSSWPST